MSIEEQTAKNLIKEFSEMLPGVKTNNSFISVYSEDMSTAIKCSIKHVNLILKATPVAGKYTKDKYQVNIEFWQSVIKILKKY